MNEEYIKEYEEMSLCDFADELVEPLSTIKKDLTKIIYIHYAKERDKNYKLEEEKYKLILDSNGLINANGILQQENSRLKDKIKDIEKILKSNHDIEHIYCALSQYLDLFDYELDLEEYLKEN